MRDILFRGKRLDYGIWEEGYYSPMDLPSYDAEPVYKPCIIRKKDLLWCKVDPATVGQYTGLTDKNGEKIFEGDIVLVRGMEAWVNGLYIVEFSEANHCWWLRNPNPTGRSFSFSDLNGFHLDGMVIGNIYDNPELLKGGGADA